MSGIVPATDRFKKDTKLRPDTNKRQQQHSGGRNVPKRHNFGTDTRDTHYT